MLVYGLVRKHYNGIVKTAVSSWCRASSNQIKKYETFLTLTETLNVAAFIKVPCEKLAKSDITDSTRWLDKYTCIECEDLRREEEQIVLDPTLTLANWLPIPLSLCLCHCKWQPASGCSINQWAGSVGKWISRRHMPLITDPQFSLTKVQSHYSTAVHV